MRYSATALTLGISALLLGCGQPGDTTKKAANEPVAAQVTVPVETISATTDQKKRRAKSEEFCRSRDIPIYKNPNSLFSEPESEVTIRTKDAVVDRAIALCYMELKGEKTDPKQLAEFDRKYNAIAKLTPAEKAVALAANPTQQQLTNANWRAESYHVMLWALGYVDELKYADKMCDSAEDVAYLASKTEAAFRDDAKLRDKTEILDQADLILRLDWACVDARASNKPVPGGLDKGIVYERHYSFNWLTGFLGQDWDDVSTDT